MSNINSLVLEAVGPLGLLASAGAGLGGIQLRHLGGALGGALGTAIGMPGSGYLLGSGLTTAGLNLAKNYMDPQLRHDHAGNILRAIGAGATGYVPGIGDVSAFYNAGGLGYHTFDRSDEYNRHRRLQDWANKTNMIQQARAGNYSPT